MPLLQYRVIGGPGLNFRGRRKAVVFLPSLLLVLHFLPVPVYFAASSSAAWAAGERSFNDAFLKNVAVAREVESQSSFEFVVEPPKTTFNSRPVTPGVSYASFLRGPPPAAPSVIPDRQNIWQDFDHDTAAKTVYILQEVSSIFNMLGAFSSPDSLFVCSIPPSLSNPPPPPPRQRDSFGSCPPRPSPVIYKTSLLQTVLLEAPG
ncbi:hypothetical protein CDAR_268141 [Caerostris darwini]|uniref:Transmembrane protein n=1 Tax=Caerostris darwini TaxID=1538125 RepID=A0AAV4R2T6_9ARAC|nr:hypothetical protein CDAR_268141 [Caerostris darwini]